MGNRRQRMTYAMAQFSSAAVGETSDCAVRAVAVATGHDYQFIRGMFHHAGRNFGEGTPDRLTKAVLWRLGYRIDDVPLAEVSGMTVRTIIRQLKSKHTYLLHTKNHVLCVKDGKGDWTTDRLIRVKAIWLVWRPHCIKCGTPTIEQYWMPPTDWESVPVRMRLLVIQNYDLDVLWAEDPETSALLLANLLEKPLPLPEKPCAYLCVPCVCNVWGLPNRSGLRTLYFVRHLRTDERDF